MNLKSEQISSSIHNSSINQFHPQSSMCLGFSLVIASSPLTVQTFQKRRNSRILGRTIKRAARILRPSFLHPEERNSLPHVARINSDPPYVVTLVVDPVLAKVWAIIQEGTVIYSQEKGWLNEWTDRLRFI